MYLRYAKHDLNILRLQSAVFKVKFYGYNVLKSIRRKVITLINIVPIFVLWQLLCYVNWKIIDELELDYNEFWCTTLNHHYTLYVYLPNSKIAQSFKLITRYVCKRVWVRRNRHNWFMLHTSLIVRTDILLMPVIGSVPK